MRTHRTRPTAAVAVLAATVSLLLAGCGGSDDDPDSDPGPATEAASDAPTSSPATSSAPASPSGGQCSPPATDLEFTAGGATLDVTDGPGVGHYELTLDSTGARENGYLAEDRELVAVFSDAAGHRLMIDIEGTDPCLPDAFVSITINPEQTFVDPSHTVCQVALTELGAAGASGTYACDGMAGGGEGVTIDATGVFTLGVQQP